MHVLVLADGDRPTRAGLDAAWPGWDRDTSLVVAADGGARLAADLGLPIDSWVGDGDSLGRDAIVALHRSGVPVEVVPADKDESDTELALRAAILLGATEITVLGALGGRRLDHALANVALLAQPDLGDRPARLVDERTRVSLIQAPGPDGGPVHRDLSGRIGDLVTLLPWGVAAEGVTTGALRFALHDETLALGPARGLSNVRTAGTASVTLRNGRLLVVESPATLNR